MKRWSCRRILGSRCSRSSLNPATVCGRPGAVGELGSHAARMRCRVARRCPRRSVSAERKDVVRTRGLISASLVVATALVASSCGTQNPQQDLGTSVLVIQEQGSFAAGGAVHTAPGMCNPLVPTDPAGPTYHGDHAYAFYQIPENAHELPIVMWHGAGQFSRTWETTPDGREGFQNIFLRRGFGTYVLDQPRRGNAGRAMIGTTIAPTPDEQMWFNQFRVGVWPDYFDGVQFSRDPQALDQYFRSMTPNTGPFDINVVSDGARPRCSTGLAPPSCSPTPRAVGQAGSLRSRTRT